DRSCRLFAGGLDVDGAVFHAPESGIAVPTVERLTVEQRDPTFVVRIIEGLPAAPESAPAAAGRRWGLHGGSWRLLRRRNFGQHEECAKATGEDQRLSLFHKVPRLI